MSKTITPEAQKRHDKMLKAKDAVLKAVCAWEETIRTPELRVAKVYDLLDAVKSLRTLGWKPPQ